VVLSNGAIDILRRTHIALAGLLFAAAFCSGQSATQTGEKSEASAQSTATTDRQTLAQPTQGTPAAGQLAPAGDQNQGQSQSKDSQKGKGTTQADATSKDRLFFTLPNFMTLENAGQVPPMTAGQKFKVVARSSFDYVQIPWYGFLAGISQAQDSEEGYGQGAAGYGKRYAAYWADGTIENFLTGAILPSVLHEDPRYFQSGTGGLGRRTGYAMSRILVTRTDSGHRQFNFSEVFGSALAAAISSYSYHPRDDRSVANTASVWGTQVGYDTITLVVREFWPDIRRKMKKQRR
jgi:hypothetical protein